MAPLSACHPRPFRPQHHVFTAEPATMRLAGSVVTPAPCLLPGSVCKATELDWASPGPGTTRVALLRPLYGPAESTYGPGKCDSVACRDCPPVPGMTGRKAKGRKRPSHSECRPPAPCETPRGKRPGPIVATSVKSGCEAVACTCADLSGENALAATRSREKNYLIQNFFSPMPA